MQRLNLLLVVPRGNILRRLEGFLRLEGQFVEADHIVFTVLFLRAVAKTKGPAYHRPQGRSRSILFHQRANMDAYFTFDAEVTFTFTWRGLDSSRLGRFTVNTPFLYSARMDSGLTVFGNEKLRLKVP